MAAMAALKEKLPKEQEKGEEEPNKYFGKELTAKEQIEAALDLETDEEEKAIMTQLVDVQSKVDDIIAAYSKERAEMSARFQSKLLEVYSQRQALIKTGTATPAASGGDSAAAPQSGEHAAAGATGGSGSGIHNFWLDVLKNCGATKTTIEEHDEPVLEYLTDIAWQALEDNEGFKLTFHFAPNPYFSNGVLTKSYPIKNMFDPMNNYDFQWKLVQGSEIEWAAGKDVTVERVKGKRRGGKPGKVTEEPRESFFHFFNCEDVDEEEIKDMGPMERQQYEQAVGSDFAVGCAIKDKVIPYAQKFYVGDPTGQDEDFEAEEEDGEWDGEGEGMDMRMLQAMLGGGGGMTPEMMQAMMEGEEGDEEEEDGALFKKKGKGTFVQQLDEEDESEDDEEEDEESAAAIRAAISGAFGGNGGGQGSLGAGLAGDEQGSEEKPKDCQQQ